MPVGFSSAPTGNQWIEVDAGRLTGNVKAFRQHVADGVRILSVVKSNGYGHDLQIAARAFAEGGVDMLATHSFDEARRIHELDLNLPILVLGPLHPSECAEAIRMGLQLTIAGVDILGVLEDVARSEDLPVGIHLKVETGTHRQGLGLQELEHCLGMIRQSGHLRLEGISSHFANIEDTTRHDFAQLQISRFDEAVARVMEHHDGAFLSHIASSAATILFPRTHRDMVRVGISAYGYWPSRETLASAREKGLDALDIAPALCWKTVISQLKEVPAGSYIGYGCTDKTEVPTRLAVLPIGYSDGYCRSFGNKAWVLVGGKRCPVRGRVCMNLIMVDVSHVKDVSVGQEVVLLGRQEDEVVSAEWMAELAGTIHYEIISGLSESIPRIVV